MSWAWTIVESIVIIALFIAFGLAAAILFETYGRRFNHAHLEAHPIFEDPNSLKQVQCPYILDPAAKYLSLITFNEEHRLPRALDETMRYLQQRATKDQSFSYEGMLHSRGELLLMLDTDGATKVTDLEKLENQICAVAEKEND